MTASILSVPLHVRNHLWLVTFLGKAWSANIWAQSVVYIESSNHRYRSKCKVIPKQRKAMSENHISGASGKTVVLSDFESTPGSAGGDTAIHHQLCASLLDGIVHQTDASHPAPIIDCLLVIADWYAEFRRAFNRTEDEQGTDACLIVYSLNQSMLKYCQNIDCCLFALASSIKHTPSNIQHTLLIITRCFLSPLSCMKICTAGKWRSQTLRWWTTSQKTSDRLLCHTQAHTAQATGPPPSVAYANLN